MESQSLSIPQQAGISTGLVTDSSQVSIKLPNLPKHGILKHGTHLADLVLFAGTHPGGFEFNAFKGHVLELVRQVKAGVFTEVNEKIDGSPAIVVGFTANNAPFVAYKQGIDRKSSQRLFTSESDVAGVYTGDSPLRDVFKDCVRLLLPALQKANLCDFTFQCDLLFTPTNRAKVITRRRFTSEPIDPESNM